MPSIVQKLDELIVAAGGQPSGSGLPIDKKVEQARDAVANLNYQLRKPSVFASAVPGEDGLIIDYNANLPDDSLFCAFVSQYTFVYGNKQCIRFQLAVPEEYRGKCEYYVIGIKPADEEVEVTLENATIKMSPLHMNRWLHHSVTNSLSGVPSGKYAMFRDVISIHEKKEWGGEVVRQILTPQVTCYNNNGTFEYSKGYFPTYDDVIVDGGLVNMQDHVKFFFGSGDYEGIRQELAENEMETGVYVQDNVDYFSQGKRKFVPYSSLVDEDILIPAFVVGNGDVILGNGIKPQLPSQSNSQGGN